MFFLNDTEHVTTLKQQRRTGKLGLEALERKRQAILLLSNEWLEMLAEPINVKVKLLGVSNAPIEIVIKTLAINLVDEILVLEKLNLLVWRIEKSRNSDCCY